MQCVVMYILESNLIKTDSALNLNSLHFVPEEIGNWR
jgi:hypothetical protein